MAKNATVQNLICHLRLSFDNKLEVNQWKICTKSQDDIWMWFAELVSQLENKQVNLTDISLLIKRYIQKSYAVHVAAEIILSLDRTTSPCYMISKKNPTVGDKNYEEFTFVNTCVQIGIYYYIYIYYG